MSEYTSALWMPTSHFWAGRKGQRVGWIILHGTAGFTTAEQVGAFFQTNSPPTSVHYVVGQDGTVVQCVNEEDSAWGNGVLSTGHDPWWQDSINPNLQTISIEHVKPDPNNATPLTAAQQAASFALVAYLCNKWGIPARAADASGGITGHFSIDPVNRSFCPGVYPWQALWNFLAGGTSTMAWTQEANGTGRDDQGHTCGAGMMAEINLLSMGGVDGLQSETYYTATESFLPFANGVVFQWDGQNVNNSHAAQVLANVWGQLKAAEAEIAALKAAPPPPPPPVPLSQADQLAIAAMAGIKAYLAV